MDHPAAVLVTRQTDHQANCVMLGTKHLWSAALSAAALGRHYRRWGISV